MGEREMYVGYQMARDYADEQARKFTCGDPTDVYQGLTGATLVAHAYELAAERAEVLAQTQGRWWRSVVVECRRLAAPYRQLASQSENKRK